MNQKVLHELFDGYISKFDIINMPPPGDDENYKWEAAAEFQSVFDIDADDFSSVLKKAKIATANLIDSSIQPLGGLAEMAEKHGESETIREMFRNLFCADGEDLTAQQQRIDTFLRRCDDLLEKHYPGSHMFKNDQRSAMAYLWFHDPERYYLCKTSEAAYFANCAGFYDDWGTYGNFNLPVYYRFCNELVDAMKEYPPLIKTHLSRYENTTRVFHPDKNLHILVFDLIYCVGRYNLYGSNRAKTQAEIKLYQEQKKKAEKLLAKVKEAELGLQNLYAAREEIIELLRTGAIVRHKAFGVAHFERLDDRSYCFTFGESNSEKKFLLSSFANGFLKIEDPRFSEILQKYSSAMMTDYTALQRLDSAKKALLPYERFLD